MPSQICYVPGCMNGYSLNCKRKKSGKEPVSLFRPPQDMLEKWTAIIQRKDRKLQKDDIVCAVHFKEEDIEHYYSHVIDGRMVLIKRGYPKLRTGALPCIFKNKKVVDDNAFGIYEEVSDQLSRQEENSLAQEMSYSNDNCNKSKTSLKLKGNKNKNKKQKTEDEITSAIVYGEINMAEDDNNESYIPVFELCRKSQKCEKMVNHDRKLSYKEEGKILNESIFTYRELAENVNRIVLPSTLWAVHRHPYNRFVSFIHTIFNPDTGVKFDKGVIFQGSCTPVVIFHGHHVPVPQLSKNVSSLNDVCKLLNELEEFRAVCLLSESPHKDVIALEN